MNPDLKYPASTTNTYSSALLDNGPEFNSSFFKSHKLSLHELELDAQTRKQYPFPTLYGDVTTSAAMFFCSFKKAASLIKTDEVKPVSMGFGRTMVAITSYRYNKVRGIDPYNEIAIAIPVIPTRKRSTPLLPIALPKQQELGFYVLSMPVTSLENQIRGKKIWGLLKKVVEIDLFSDGNEYVTISKNSAATTALKLSIPMNWSQDHSPVESTIDLYSHKDSLVYKSTSRVNAAYSAKNYLSPWLGISNKHSNSTLELGEGEDADLLRSLDIDSNPFRTQFSMGVESSFSLPKVLN